MLTRRIAIALLTMAIATLGLLLIGQPAHAVATVNCKRGVKGPDLAAARIILRVGHRMHARPKVLLSAFETAWVESRVNNCVNGDGTSVGVFQQTSIGWGTYAQRTNVSFAARSYFRLAIAYWKKKPYRSAGQIAQAVQRSAYPLRYDQCRSVSLSLITTTTRLLARETSGPAK